MDGVSRVAAAFLGFIALNQTCLLRTGFYGFFLLDLPRLGRFYHYIRSHCSYFLSTQWSFSADIVYLMGVISPDCLLYT